MLIKKITLRNQFSTSGKIAGFGGFEKSENSLISAWSASSSEYPVPTPGKKGAFARSVFFSRSAYSASPTLTNCAFTAFFVTSTRKHPKGNLEREGALMKHIPLSNNAKGKRKAGRAGEKKRKGYSGNVNRNTLSG